MARKPARVISHWYRYVEDFSTSGLEFYAAVEEVGTRRGLPGVTLSRVRFMEGGIFSARREYLRVQKERTVFDICAGPYGRGGYFFSWRLGELRGGLLARPVGWLCDRFFRPTTYYRLDTALLFQEAVQASVDEVLAGLLSQQGLRVLLPAPGPSWDLRRPPRLSDTVSLGGRMTGGYPREH
ncbi:MAG TPA: hypothetical protein VLF66_10140 [Thermoanaerobaculia bacterium]|nr:hypothetical protein [Thermoanaerobaculia bacterium]